MVLAAVRLTAPFPPASFAGLSTWDRRRLLERRCVPCAQRQVLEAVENLSATPGLAEGERCAKAVAGMLLPALAALVEAARGDADTRFRGLKLLYDIIALFLGDYDDGANNITMQMLGPQCRGLPRSADLWFYSHLCLRPCMHLACCEKRSLASWLIGSLTSSPLSAR